MAVFKFAAFIFSVYCVCTGADAFCHFCLINEYDDDDDDAEDRSLRLVRLHYCEGLDTEVLWEEPRRLSVIRRSTLWRRCVDTVPTQQQIDYAALSISPLTNNVIS